MVFYTNYLSRKGREIESTGRVSAAMHWDHAERQARVEGVAVRMSEAESDEYFRSRELLKRLAAWASEQSAPITTRSEMIDKMLVVMKRFGVTIPEALRGESSAVVPRPPHWGGYRIVPGVVELWAGGQGRMHDRAAWTWTNAGWTATRLQP